jgi:hypothetical protein
MFFPAFDGLISLLSPTDPKLGGSGGAKIGRIVGRSANEAQETPRQPFAPEEQLTRSLEFGLPRHAALRQFDGHRPASQHGVDADVNARLAQAERFEDRMSFGSSDLQCRDDDKKPGGWEGPGKRHRSFPKHGVQCADARKNDSPFRKRRPLDCAWPT